MQTLLTIRQSPGDDRVSVWASPYGSFSSNLTLVLIVRMKRYNEQFNVSSTLAVACGGVGGNFSKDDGVFRDVTISLFWRWELPAYDYG